MKKSILIGITGGIGSGKSMVAGYLSRLGEHVISADETAREAVLPGERGSELIRKEFGDSFFKENGTLDRKMLASFVFGDAQKLKRLNAILHPLILERIYAEAENASGRVFIEVPLLIQSGMHDSMDFVWLVVADENERISRVTQRDTTDRAAVMRRIRNQMSDEEMAAYADEVIVNSASPQELYRKVDELLKKPEYKR